MGAGCWRRGLPEGGVGCLGRGLSGWPGLSVAGLPYGGGGRGRGLPEARVDCVVLSSKLIMSHTHTHIAGGEIVRERLMKRRRWSENNNYGAGAGQCHHVPANHPRVSPRLACPGGPGRMGYHFLPFPLSAPPPCDPGWGACPPPWDFPLETKKAKGETKQQSRKTSKLIKKLLKEVLTPDRRT